VYLISDMRTKYRRESETFTEEGLIGKEPFSQFREWFEEACQHPLIPEANAVCVATATR
jgi:pyridoxamine 5'-phosphate oxidase